MQRRKYRCCNHEASLRAGLVLSRRIVQQGKWQRKKQRPPEDEIEKPPLAVVADATGHAFRVSLQELVAGYQVLVLYDKQGRLICNKPKLGRGKRRKETIALSEIRRVVNPPNVEMPAVVS